MSDNNIEVKFGAQTTELKQGTAQAAASVEQAIARMEKAFANMAGNLRGSSSQVNSSLESIKQSSEASAKAIEGTTSLLGRFFAIGSIIAAAREIAQFSDSVTLVQARLKLATQSSEEFAEAQKRIYSIAQANNIGIAEVTQLYTKLADPVRRLGGDARETAGIVDAFATSLRIGGASTQEAASATLQFAQAMASGKLSGDEFRAMAEASPRFMKALAEGMNAPVEKLKQMGSDGKLTADVVGNALLKELGKLKSESAGLPDTVGGAFTRLKNDVYEAVRMFKEAGDQSTFLVRAIGILNEYVKELGKLFTDTKSSTRGAIDEMTTLNLVTKAIGTTIEVVLVLFANLKFIVTTIARDFIALGAAIGAVAKGDFKAIPGIFEEAANEAKKARSELDEYEKRVLQVTDNVAKARENSRGKSFADPRRVDTGGGEEFKQLKSTVAPEDKNALAKFDLELERMKLAHEKMNKENGTFYEFSKEREARFWEEKLKVAGLTEEQRMAIEKKAIGKRLEIQKADFESTLAQYKVQLETYKGNFAKQIEIAENAAELIKQKYGEESKEYQLAQSQIVAIKRAAVEQIKAIEEIHRAGQVNARLSEIALEERNAQLEFQLGLKTNAEMIELERKFEEERVAIQKQGLAERIAIAAQDPNKNAVEIAKLLEQIQELERNHQLKLNDIRAKGAVEQNKWTKMVFDNMQTGLTGVLSQFLRGTMTIGSLTRNLAATVLNSMTDVLAKYLVQQIMTSETLKAVKLKEAGTVVAANAAEAGSGAAASQASIPYVGPALAAAAFAGTIALVMGAMKLFSASKGFDVPAGTNPLTQLHESEMVLPKEHADTIRSMAGGGGQQGMTVNISAVDARSVRDLFMREGVALADSIHRQARNFKMTSNSMKVAR